MKFFYHCPECGSKFSTHVDVESLEDLLDCTITCTCNRDIFIKAVDLDSNWVECESINYDAYIEFI